MTDKTPTTFPGALAAIEADNVGPRPISEAIGSAVLKADAMRNLRRAISMADLDCWASAYVYFYGPKQPPFRRKHNVSILLHHVLCVACATSWT